MRSGNASWSLFSGSREPREGLGARTFGTTIWQLVQAWGRGRAGNRETRQEAVGPDEVVTIGSEKTLSLI